METNDKIENVKESIKIKGEQKELHIMHYHGDRVRNLFIWIAVIMLGMTPFFQDRLPIPAFLSIFGVLVFSMLAGLTNPKSRPIIIFNFIISIVALLNFGYESVVSYHNVATDTFFLLNLGLATLSLFATYFSSKTLRGYLLYQV